MPRESLLPSSEAQGQWKRITNWYNANLASPQCTSSQSMSSQYRVLLPNANSQTSAPVAR